MPRKPNPRNQARNKQIISQYLGGASYEEVAAKAGLTDSGVWAVLSRANIQRNKIALDQNHLTKAVDICRRERRTRRIQKLPKLNGEIRGKVKNVGAFDVVTPESAYWAGLLMADGSIVPHPRGGAQLVLQLTGPDMSHVDKFRTFLQSENSITEIPAGITSQGWTRNRAKRMAVSTSHLIAALSHYGVTKNKTYAAKCGLVASHPDFWRGVIDGDGSIVPKGVMLFGSRELVFHFKKFVKMIYPLAVIAAAPHKNIFAASANGRTAAVILHCLYEHGGPALQRKRQRAIEFSRRFTDHGKSCSQ